MQYNWDPVLYLERHLLTKTAELLRAEARRLSFSEWLERGVHMYLTKSEQVNDFLNFNANINEY